MNRSRRLWKMLAGTAAAGGLLFVLTGASWAQLGGLGGGILQGLPGTINNTTNDLGRKVTTTTDDLGRTANSTLDTVKRDAIGRRVAPQQLDRDPLGARIVRGEILAVSPSAAGLAAAKQLDFEVLRSEPLADLGLTAVALRIPHGMSASDALAALKKADPQGSYDYDHLYDPSGANAVVAAPAAAMSLPNATAARIGMIDGGIAVRHPAFADAKILAKNVVGSGNGPPTAHGTAVASLLVGEAGDFHGYLPGATLYAADAFGGETIGGGAIDIVRALDWLAANRVAVTNISLAGPPNALLQAGVRAFLARGHVLVAAVGNAGPAAPPAYPASYPGVIAVTSVDMERRVQIDAGRGEVTFAALGVDVRAASVRGYAKVTGTSFAAPAVAARFALLMPQPDVYAAQRATAMLEHAALPLGTAPRDPATGYGYLAAPSVAVAGR
ncbi:MAG: S8 family serine peptidase [Alphaproteobacteria bacterium]|nr:S8 family serine peptidase [Alphaproteobacteria bacterium]MDE2630099.1 S8 family serine peptidase [Alphaproteobacteria bacterium]